MEGLEGEGQKGDMGMDVRLPMVGRSRWSAVGGRRRWVYLTGQGYDELTKLATRGAGAATGRWTSDEGRRDETRRWRRRAAVRMSWCRTKSTSWELGAGS